MKAFLGSLLFQLALAAGSTSSSRCKAVTLTVNGSAQNRNITGIPLTGLDALVKFFNAAPVVSVTGPQTLSATYCEASKISPNNLKLQVLYSSIFANKGSWMAEGGPGTDYAPFQPEKYSWTDYANALGYPTLAVDRLGTGKSAHPEPIVIVQAPYEIALYNNLAQQLRAGSTKVLPRAFPHLIYVGNSYGSQLGAGLANSFPSSYNEFLLTGFSDNFQQDFVGVTLAGPAPAAVADPARFGTLDPGYLTTTIESGQTGAFFGSHAQVDFDDAAAHIFFQRRDVVSVGQLASIYGLIFNAPKYTGRVFVLDGENDQATCGPGSPTLGPANCAAQGQPAQTGKTLFPAAQYNYKTVNRIGHGVQLHTRSQLLFNIAHRWLAGETFRGGPPA